MRLEGEDKGRRRREGTRRNGRKGRNREVERAGGERKRNP